MNSRHSFYFKVTRFIILFVCLGFVFFSNSANAQDNLTKEQTEEVFKSLAKYTSGAYDKTTQFLKKQGYQPPAYLQKEWKQYPAVRKIEMAYEAAENGSKKGGKKFLAMLSKDLAQRYEAVNHEDKLKPMIDEKVKSNKIKFKHPKKYGNIKLPNQIKKQILSISKYTEVGALGGTRGVLKHKFGLPDEKVYDILKNSNSSKEALEKGLSQSKVPPSHQERLRNVSRDLQKNYEGARKDKALTEATKKKNQGNSGSDNQKSRKKVTSDFSKKTQLTNPNSKPINTHTKARYNSYSKTNYSTPKAKKFGSMTIKRGGFGGVIFGNEVIDKTNLPSLKSIRYIPTEHLSPDSLPMGALEFIFEDGSEFLEHSVLLEDIVAANEIVFGEEIQYVKGNGIGLAGIENSIFYPDSSSRWEVVVHPAIANFELGWAALFSDVFPIASVEMLEKLKEGSNEDDYFTGLLWHLLGTPETWKIIDVPIAITNEDNRLNFFRNDLIDSMRVQGAFITMQGFKNELLPEEEKLFYEIVPSLSNSIYEFHRINEFARVLALFRWAKGKGGKLLNHPKNINYVIAPESVFVTKDKRIQYFTLEEEITNFKNFKSLVLDSMNLNISQFNNKEMSSFHGAFMKNLRVYDDELIKNWKLLSALNNSNNLGEICDFKIASPDSVLATTNFNKILRKDSKVFILDSLNNDLRRSQFELAEIELARLLIISRADTLLMENAPDSLFKFQELKNSLLTFVGETEEEEEIHQRQTLSKIDDLLSNTIEDYPLLLLYKAFSTFAIEEIESELSQSDFTEIGYGEWRRKYSEIIQIFSIEKSVIESIQKRYCNN